MATIDSEDHYRIEARHNKEMGETWWEFREIEALPDEWSVIVGEFAFNLRSALDLAVQQLARSDANTPGKRAAFPIFSVHTEYEGQRPIYLAGVDPRHWPLFDAVQPFRVNRSEFDDLAWLTNEDQHRDVHPHFLSYREGELTFIFGQRIPGNAIHDARVGAPGQFLVDGALVAYVRQDGSAVTGIKVDAKLDVAFGERRLMWQHFESIGSAVAEVLDDIGSAIRENST